MERRWKKKKLYKENERTRLIDILHLLDKSFFVLKHARKMSGDSHSV